MFSDDERGAQVAWEEYHKAIKKYGLDDMAGVDAWHKNIIGYMSDGFFAGFYAGRDYQRGIEGDEK